MSREWNNEHFRTEGTLPAADGTVCGCVYCCACREINALTGKLEAALEYGRGKEKWAVMLKVDLNTAMNQRDHYKTLLDEMSETMGVEYDYLPSRAEKLKEEVAELVEESIAVDSYLSDIWQALEGYDRPMLPSLGLALYVTRMRQQLESELAKSDRKGYEEFQKVEALMAQIKRMKEDHA